MSAWSRGETYSEDKRRDYGELVQWNSHREFEGIKRPRRLSTCYVWKRRGTNTNQMGFSYMEIWFKTNGIFTGTCMRYRNEVEFCYCKEDHVIKIIIFNNWYICNLQLLFLEDHTCFL